MVGVFDNDRLGFSRTGMSRGTWEKINAQTGNQYLQPWPIDGVQHGKTTTLPNIGSKQGARCRQPNQPLPQDNYYHCRYTGNHHQPSDPTHPKLRNIGSPLQVDRWRQKNRQPHQVDCQKRIGGRTTTPGATNRIPGKISMEMDLQCTINQARPKQQPSSKAVLSNPVDC